MNTETTSALGGDLSPAEQAYFSSKGADTAGLETSEAQAPITQEAGPDPLSEAQPAANDDQVDAGEVYIDENGKARSVVSGKFVPHGAFHKERERRKATEAELQTYREKMARADERLSVLNEIISTGESNPQPQQAQTAEDAPPPDPEVDIFAYVKWQAEQIKKLEGEHKTQAQQRENARLATEVQTYYRNDALAFVKETPDFADAYQYVAQSYANEMRARGLNDQQIQQQLMAEESAIAYQSMLRKTSPARTIYEMAKARGWSAKGPQPSNVQPAAQQKIATIQKAQNVTATLSGAGTSGGEGLTAEALANMSEEEFAAVSARIGKNKMRQLLGG